MLGSVAKIRIKGILLLQVKTNWYSSCKYAAMQLLCMLFNYFNRIFMTEVLFYFSSVT